MNKFIHDTLVNIWQTVGKINDKIFRSGADFSGWMTPEESGIKGSPGHVYRPTTDQLRRVIKRFSINEKDAFLDVGCGKGKAMYLMRKLPFRKICGYDLSHKLVEIANNNFKKLKLTKCEAFQADAMDFTDYDEFNYIFLWNPFPPEVFKVMMGHLMDSIERNPRKIVLIYLNSVNHDWIEASTPFRIVYKSKSVHPWFTYSCYENIIGSNNSENKK